MGSTRWNVLDGPRLVVGAAVLTIVAALGGCALPSSRSTETTAGASASTSAAAVATTATAPVTRSAVEATTTPTTSVTSSTASPGGATESTTAATPPPANNATPTPRPTRPTPGREVVSKDWGNNAYPIDCLEAGSRGVVLAGGSGKAVPEDLAMTAELRAAVDVGDGATVVWLYCEATAYVYGLHAVLIGDDYAILDDLAIGPTESLDGLSYTAPYREGWEAGSHPYDAASSQRHTLVVNGGRLTVDEGPITPKCAPIGIDLPSLGRPAVSEGRLVQAFQQKLIDLGYGAEIQASGGADGFLGAGTIQAFNQYFGDNWDYNDLTRPAGWYGDYESGQPIPYWLDIGWTGVLGLTCSGTYDPPLADG